MRQIQEFSVLSIEDSFSKLGSVQTGLTKQEAATRLQQFGRNELPEAKKKINTVFLF